MSKCVREAGLSALSSGPEPEPNKGRVPEVGRRASSLRLTVNPRPVKVWPHGDWSNRLSKTPGRPAGPEESDGRGNGQPWTAGTKGYGRGIEPGARDSLCPVFSKHTDAFCKPVAGTLLNPGAMQNRFHKVISALFSSRTQFGETPFCGETWY